MSNLELRVRLTLIDEILGTAAADRICQAVFTLHGITVDDEAHGDRTGGIGSTDR